MDGGRPQLFIAPRSPFCRMVVAYAVEAGFGDQLALKVIDPWSYEPFRQINPLCKVPALALTDGQVLLDSRVIVRYIGDITGRSLLPPGERLWQALSREALAHGLVEAVIRRFVERSSPESQRSCKLAARQEEAISAVLDKYEADPGWMHSDLDVGHVAAACAIAYLDGRSPELEWQNRRPLLTRWFYDFRSRPSMTTAASLESDGLHSFDRIVSAPRPDGGVNSPNRKRPSETHSFAPLCKDRSL